jgi:hypothetical protein
MVLGQRVLFIILSPREHILFKPLSKIRSTINSIILYDNRKNEFMADSSLWSFETIENQSRMIPTKEVNYKVQADKTTHEKMHHMDLSLTLRIDFLGGLISVSGSAGYMKDTTAIETEINVELSYHTTKYTRTLPKYTEKDHPEECSNKRYTHAVTSVVFGLDAWFVFKRKVSVHESKSDLTGSLKFAIGMIPGLGISVEGDTNLTDAEKNALNKTTIHMFGDFSPDETLPTNFNESINFFKNLPFMMGSSEENYPGATIMNVQMTPMTELCSEADFILNEISESLMSQVIMVSDKLEQLTIKIGTLLDSDPSQRFSPLHENLNFYSRALEDYRINFKTQLQTLLPNIRGGTGHSEEDLVTLLNEYLRSQFEFERSSHFLTNRTREVEALRILIETIPAWSNIAINDFESADDIECIFQHDSACIMHFNIISPQNVTEGFLNGTLIDEAFLWYNNFSLVGVVGEQLRIFRDFAIHNVDQNNRCYLISIHPLKLNPIEVYAYKKDSPAKKFEPPDAPAKPNNISVTHESISFYVVKPSEFVLGCEISIVKLMDLGSSIVRQIPFPAASETGKEVLMNVDHLAAANGYTFKLNYITDFGTSPDCEDSDIINTAPSSQPQTLMPTSVSLNSISLTWDAPSVIGVGIDSLTYVIRTKGL